MNQGLLYWMGRMPAAALRCLTLNVFLVLALAHHKVILKGIAMKLKGCKQGQKRGAVIIFYVLFLVCASFLCLIRQWSSCPVPANQRLIRHNLLLLKVRDMSGTTAPTAYTRVCCYVSLDVQMRLKTHFEQNLVGKTFVIVFNASNAKGKCLQLGS